MSIRIGSNLASEKVQRNLSNTTEEQTKELQRLSSGKRIISAGDDPAGLGIGTALEAQVKGLRQATRNANDGISFIQVAEGALTEISTMLIRLRELSVQAASDTVGEDEREFLDLEYQALMEEIDRIANSTTYNGTTLVNGESESGELDFHVGAFGGEIHKITYNPDDTNATTDGLDIDGLEVADKDDAEDAIEDLDEAIVNLSGQRARLGALQSRLHHTVQNLQTQTINMDSARSNIQDTDIAKSASNLVAKNIIKSAGTSTLAQANNLPAAALSLL